MDFANEHCRNDVNSAGLRMYNTSIILYLCKILLAALKITRRHSICPQSMISFLLAKIYNYYTISSDLIRDILSSSIRGLKLLKSCD